MPRSHSRPVGLTAVIRLVRRPGIVAVPMLTFVLLTSACWQRGALPAREMYRLAVPDTVANGQPLTIPLSRLTPRAPLQGALAISPYRTEGIYGGQNIIYRIGEYEYNTYPGREWAMPLATMLGRITERVLIARPLSEEPAVFDPPTRLAHPYTWQGTVRHFEEVNRERDVFVSVEFEVRLVRSADQTVVWTGSAAIERPVPEGTMTAIIEALSAASADAVASLIADAQLALEQAPPTAIR